MASIGIEWVLWRDPVSDVAAFHLRFDGGVMSKPVGP
jgi:hypothetical protein